MSVARFRVPSRPVLILGGGGFLGVNLINRLLAEGARVTSYSRSFLTTRIHPGLAYEEAGEGDLARVESLIAESAMVYHMAHGFTAATPRATLTDRLPALMELNNTVMRACRRYDVPLIYLSSGGTVYGRAERVPTPESAPTAPINFYGITKLAAERYFTAEPGLDCRVLRISNPYGPWQFGIGGQGVIGTWMQRLQHGETLTIRGNGEAARDYIYVDDVVEALLKTADHDGPGQLFNIGSGKGLSLNELLQVFRGLFDVDLQCRYVPAAPSDVPVSVLDISRADRELDWRPTVGLEEGLRRTRAWLDHPDRHLVR